MPSKGSKHGFWLSKVHYTALSALILWNAAAPLAAWAAQYDIKVMTPEVQQAINGRQQRYDAVQNLKNQGVLGENNRGYLEALQSAGAPLAQQENADRRVIYSAIVQQNGLGAAGMNQVEFAFSDVQRDRARSGDMIQLPSGEWVKK